MKRVINKNGNFIFEVDGREILPAAYMSYSPADADYSGFREIGYRMFSYSIYAGDLPTNEENGFFRSWEPGCWVAEDKFDFSPLDRGMERVIGDCEEDIYVILRINLNMPLWWREKYPEELMHYAGGRTLMQSVCSLKWREDACVYLKKLKEHIDASTYKKSIIAWQVAGMQTEEWIHPSKYRLELEEELPLLYRFRAWCKERYSDIKALNRVWDTSYTDFDAITLPSGAELGEKNISGAKTPVGRRVRDYHICLNEAYGDTISYFTRFVKELYGGDIFCGAFTGYIGQLQDFQGHSTMSRLINEESIDFFASPFTYVAARGAGVDWFYHSPMQSVTNAGKLWFLEADVRTCLTRHLADTRPDVCDRALPYFNEPVFFGPKTEEQSEANILRSFSKFFISGHAYWWFDMWGGWYKSERFMNLHSRLYELYKQKVQSPVKNNTEVAVVLDNAASYEVSGKTYWASVFNQLVELGYLGAPYDLLLLDKISEDEINKYKMFICLSPDRNTNEYSELKKRLDKAGKTLLVTGEDESGEVVSYTREDYIRLASECGVFIYSRGNIVYANEKYIAVTATADGEISLNTQRDGVLEDMIDGTLLETKGNRVSWQTEFNLCRLLKWRN